MRLHRWLLGGMALVCMLSPGNGRAETPLLDLGGEQIDGQLALNSMDERAGRVIDALACRDELRFLNELESGNTSGTWPYRYLIAKAAFLERTRPDATCKLEDEPRLDDWKRQFIDDDGKEKFDGGARSWAAFVDAGTGDADGGARSRAFAAAVNARYVQFGEACASVAHPTGRGIGLELTRACLATQIASVIGNPRLGRWIYEEDSGELIPVLMNPGTDGLPCLSKFAGGGKGDWDMRVIEYTRLEFFLARALDMDPALRPIASAALEKINTWLLTLRGEPAEESYSLLFSCGNPDNQSGTPQDYVAGNTDGVAGQAYEDELGDSLGGGSSGVPAWLKWLAFLALVVLVVITVGAAAGAAGAALGGMLGAAAVGAVAAGAAIVLVLGVAGSASIPETENHLLMQNVSKYLKNKSMLAELERDGDTQGASELAAANGRVRLWLFHRMARIAREDFIEYNSRSYGRLSHFALLNLADFACPRAPKAADVLQYNAIDPCTREDVALRTAVSAVLDLSAAKAAVGSVQARRVTPFRRLAVEDARYRGTWWFQHDLDKACEGEDTRVDPGDDRCKTPPRRIMELGTGSDHPVAALQFWTGATEHGPERLASNASLSQMLWHATSTYRPSALILDLAIDKSAPMEQEFNHWAPERYSSGRRWLLTAGGDSAPLAYGSDIFGVEVRVPFLQTANDRGVGVPTTLMAYTRQPPRQDRYQDLLRFEGDKEHWGEDDEGNAYASSSNRCVTTGFACGMQLEIPQPVVECLDRSSPIATASGSVRFLSSTSCAYYADGDGNHDNDFFAAVFGAGCRKSDGAESCDWGFVQLVDAIDFQDGLDGQDGYTGRFANNNRAQLALMGNADGRYSLWSPSSDAPIQFTPRNQDFGRGCRACGEIEHLKGAKFVIGHPRHPGQWIEIDLDNPTSPRRVGKGGAHVEQ